MIRRESGVKRFDREVKTLKWAGFACPFESNGGPAKAELFVGRPWRIT